MIIKWHNSRFFFNYIIVHKILKSWLFMFDSKIILLSLFLELFKVTWSIFWKLFIFNTLFKIIINCFLFWFGLGNRFWSYLWLSFLNIFSLFHYLINFCNYYFFFLFIIIIKLLFQFIFFILFDFFKSAINKLLKSTKLMLLSND